MSEPDPLMPWRVLTYLQRIWAAVLRDEPGRRSLPPIVPVVVHHGAGGWSAPHRLHELIEGLAELPELARHVPELELLIDDLVAVPDERLRTRPLPAIPPLALWLLRDARDPTVFLADVDAWIDDLRQAIRDGGVDRVEVLLRYTVRVAGRDSFDRLFQLVNGLAADEGTTMITAAQSYCEEGRERGLEQGRERGLEEGLRTALHRLLARRFAPLDDATLVALERAPRPTLERWFERALTAASLADVLTDD